MQEFKMLEKCLESERSRQVVNKEYSNLQYSENNVLKKSTGSLFNNNAIGGNQNMQTEQN
jgi:hypothetical protein